MAATTAIMQQQQHQTTSSATTGAAMHSDSDASGRHSPLIHEHRSTSSSEDEDMMMMMGRDSSSPQPSPKVSNGIDHSNSSKEIDASKKDSNDKSSSVLMTSDDEEDDDDEEHEIDVDNRPPSSDQNRVTSSRSDNDEMSESETETVIDETNENSQSSLNLSVTANNSSNVESNASLAALMNLKAFTTSERHSAGNKQHKLFSTGKLEKITERLAKKQNGGSSGVENVLTNNHNSSSNLTSALNVAASSSSFLSSSSSSSSSGDSNDNQKVELVTSSNEADEDEDDDEIKNGFRALGLMGNVAFLSDESFKCPVCGLKLDSQHTFTLHIRSHNPNDHSNTCSLCGKTLSSASSLDRHMLIHSGERPFKCTLCGMAFTTNGNMHRHMRTHGHGSIGYTPRGQKRRAKLLTQALEKAAAAAAAGEPVDLAAITKLKKSVLESSSKVAPSQLSVSSITPSSVGSGKKRVKEQNQSNQLMANAYLSNQNVSIEAAAAAAVAAAAASTTHGNSKSKHSTSHHYRHSLSNTHPNQSQKYSSLNHTPSHLEPQPNVPLNLAGNNASWPQDVPARMEKSKPGRKKKQRFSYPLSTATPNATVPPTMPSFPAEDILSNTASFNINTPSRCPICTQGVRTKMDLHIHMASLHPREKLFCLDCGMILENYNTYTQHHCTATAAAVMAALSQNPNASSELLFRSTNTSRMNFSSARTVSFPGLGLFGSFPPSHDASSLLSQAQSLNKLSQSSSNLFPTNTKDSNSGYSTPGQQHHSSQPLMDLTSSATGLKFSPSAFSQSSTTSCGQCHRKFSNSKELKHHMDTYCHECNTDCIMPTNFFAHQLSHNLEKFPALSKALEADKMQALKTAAAAAAVAAFPNLLPLSHSNESKLISPNHNPPESSPHSTSKRDVPKYSSPSLDLSINTALTSAPAMSSIASLTSTMADMKSDLADIQSIISMAKHAKLPLPSSNTRHPISPNRASDAGDFNRVHRYAIGGGDATNQPDSPASADSAAGAVASSSMSTSLHGDRQHITKTDMNENSTTALCLKQTSPNSAAVSNATNGHNGYDEEEEQQQHSDIVPNKRRRSNSVSSSSSTTHNDQTDDHLMKTSSNNGGSSASSSESPRFRCEPCRLSFKSMNAFRRHNRGHTAGGGHSHACHLCPYKSLDKSTLIRHLRTHNGERPFQCAICKYAFTTKANCERHVRKRHRNLKSKNEIRSAMQYNRDMAATAAATRLVSEKIFIERDELPTSQDTICKQCSVDFGTNRELRAHLRVPNNPCSQQLKPFVCTICKIGFNTRNNCVRHIIKQHPTTIEVTDEEAAKVAEESMMIETGSSSSLSPSSNGHVSIHSFSGSLSTTSSEHLSECESYGTYEDENCEQLMNGSSRKSSKYDDHSPSSHTNSSFAALCQVAEQVTSNGHSKSSESKKDRTSSEYRNSSSNTNTTTATIPLNLSTKTEFDLSGKCDNEELGPSVLDLSCKSKEQLSC